MNKLFDPVSMGSLLLQNRLDMAPMTRGRAQYDGTPGALAVDYYAQRASVGLIVSEGTQPSDEGQGYPGTPGIYTPAHVAGWARIADPVKARGGHFFLQLMHAGRIAHPLNTLHRGPGVAPSAMAPGTAIFTPNGMQDVPVPRVLSSTEVRQTVRDFRFAAQHAMDAGADGVEIHGAYGFLVQQFFAPSANVRTDRYGGPVENRARFAIEVAIAIADEIGASRTAIRLSFGSTMLGIDEGPEGPDLYRYLVGELDKLGLVYLHVMHPGDDRLMADLRRLWRGTLIMNRPGPPVAEIGADISSGQADLESYGQAILANPDFVARLKANSSMNEPRRQSFFGGDHRGYIDYPALQQVECLDTI
jgi:N-ethylmaleimide reductase